MAESGSDSSSDIRATAWVGRRSWHPLLLSVYVAYLWWGYVLSGRASTEVHATYWFLAVAAAVVGCWLNVRAKDKFDIEHEGFRDQPGAALGHWSASYTGYLAMFDSLVKTPRHPGARWG